MSSVKDEIKMGKRAIAAIEVIFVLLLSLILLVVLLNINVGGISKAGKVKCFSGGIVEGFCVSKEADCSGMVNTMFKCPESTPFCCLQKAGAVKGAAAPASSGAAESATTQASTEAELKGTVDLYCNCKPLEGNTLVKSGAAEKLSLKSRSSGDTDFMADVNTEFTFSVRSTDDIHYCRITCAQCYNKLVEGFCDKDSGSGILIKFEKTGDYDIVAEGYDKKGGKRISSLVADIKVK